MKFYCSLSVLCSILAVLCITGCNGRSESSGKPLVVCTTTMISDLAKNLAAGRFQVIGVMRPGEDPHTYTAKPVDAVNISKARIVLRNGLHLEGNLIKIIENNLASGALDVPLAETDAIEPMESKKYKGAPDPHCWFNVRYFKVYAQRCRDAFIEADPAGKEQFEKAAAIYIEKLDRLNDEIEKKLATIPKKRRVLVSSHDAFQYFGMAYDIEVHAVIGISTEQQPRPQDIENLKELVTARGVKAVFIETSVSSGLNNIVRKIGSDTGVSIGGTLYSDSLGAGNSPAATYLGMVEQNVDAIVKALK